MNIGSLQSLNVTSRVVYGFIIASMLLLLSLTSVGSAYSTVPSTDVKILIDATRGGGVWWSPQTPPTFDPNAPHQGKLLADYFRSLGHEVVELPRDPTIVIDFVLLSGFDIVLAYSSITSPGYSATEVEAYKNYVSFGGGLMLISDHGGDRLSSEFGLNWLQGLTHPVSGSVTLFTAHPLTQGVSSIPFVGATGLAEPFHDGIVILGLLPETTFVDLDNDELQDPNESGGSPILGIINICGGMIVFFGDLNGLEQVPQPFTDNYLAWLLAAAEDSVPCPVDARVPELGFEFALIIGLTLPVLILVWKRALSKIP